MRPYEKYVVSTTLYGVFGILGWFGLVYFTMHADYFLAIISLLIIYVSFDNFFCSSRAKKCGIAARGHYTFPRFLKQ